MPQLDSNTFFYQFIGILVLLILIYLLVSYFLLPILLRASIIRLKFSEINTSLGDFFSDNLSVSRASSLLVDRSLYIFNYSNTVLKNVVSDFLILVNFFNKINLSIKKVGVTFFNKTSFLSFTSNYYLYLIMILYDLLVEEDSPINATINQ